MVRIKQYQHILDDGSVNLEAWLAYLDTKLHYSDLTRIRNACVLAQLTGASHLTETGESCLQQGLAIAEILSDLNMDQDTIAAAIIYPTVQYADLSLEDVAEQLGEKVAKMVKGVRSMVSLSQLTQLDSHNMQHVDNVRKMMLAMVDDVRIVLIKLAERLQILRAARHLPDPAKQRIAHDTMDIFAPLANRLGVGQIKWEMEDLSFRYLEPATYKEIAKGLKTRRVDRDNYVNNIVTLLEQEVEKAGIKHATVYGRSKHIHSIHRKMQRKKVSLDQIYDATAVRILVTTEEDCYTALSIVHSLWRAIPDEFDDYIANPKSNGYRSLHTAVIGPQDRIFEVQIRTFAMDDEAELGVAAHWKYKEKPVSKKTDHEGKIAWLREVLAWQQEIASEAQQPEGASIPDYLEERIYVFTPNGKIIDLPKGSTPLDFAYHVHTEIGHCCRGAKINGKMVPLTYQLHTGEQVEILTLKNGKPSRDWLNPHLGYLHSARAKAKVLHWFKQQDYDQHRHDGEILLANELKKLGAASTNQQQLAEALHYAKTDDLYAALGRGDLGIASILRAVQAQGQLPAEAPPLLPIIRPRSRALPDNVYIEGIGNLLSHMARCCQPIPGDPIVGYITLSQGLAIHHQECANVLEIKNTPKEARLLAVNWGDQTSKAYQVNLQLTVFNRPGLLHDITSVCSVEKVNVVSFNTDSKDNEARGMITIVIEVNTLEGLSRILDKLAHIPNVINVLRIR